MAADVPQLSDEDEAVAEAVAVAEAEAVDVAGGGGVGWPKPHPHPPGVRPGVSCCPHPHLILILQAFNQALADAVDKVYTMPTWSMSDRLYDRAACDHRTSG